MIKNKKISNDCQFVDVTFCPNDDLTYECQIINRTDILSDGFHITLGNIERHEKISGLIGTLVYKGLLGDEEAIKKHKIKYKESSLEEDIKEIFKGE